MFSSIFRDAGACGVAKAIYKQLCFSHLVLIIIIIIIKNAVNGVEVNISVKYLKFIF